MKRNLFHKKNHNKSLNTYLHIYIIFMLSRYSPSICRDNIIVWQLRCSRGTFLVQQLSSKWTSLLSKQWKRLCWEIVWVMQIVLVIYLICCYIGIDGDSNYNLCTSMSLSKWSAMALSSCWWKTFHYIRVNTCRRKFIALFRQQIYDIMFVKTTNAWKNSSVLSFYFSNFMTWHI